MSRPDWASIILTDAISKHYDNASKARAELWDAVASLADGIAQHARRTAQDIRNDKYVTANDCDSESVIDRMKRLIDKIRTLPSAT